MQQELLQIVAITIFIGFIIYLVFRSLILQNSVMEGLANANDVTNGEGSTSEEYANKVKDATVQMQDALLISKYRTNYESSIVNLDDYFNALMLKTAMNINPDNGSDESNMSLIKNLNELNAAKISLNATMKYIDSV